MEAAVSSKMLAPWNGKTSKYEAEIYWKDWQKIWTVISLQTLVGDQVWTSPNSRSSSLRYVV
jgi:hypothetical protein